jgi:hypothetical protein
VGASLSIGGDAIVTGNLTVNGDTQYTNVTTLAIEDPIISIGRGANNTALSSNDGKDRGTQLYYYNTAERNAFMGYDENVGKMLLATNVSVSSDVVTVIQYGNTLVGDLEASANVSATGNVVGGNITSAGVANVNTLLVRSSSGAAASVVGNIVGGNITTGGVLSATGNITGGNVNGGANVFATIHTGTTVSVSGNVTGGNLISSGIASAVGNITGANIITAGLVTATGVVYGSSFVGSGSGLTNLTGANVTGTVANATFATSAGSATTAGTATSATTAGFATSATSASTATTVTAAAQPNITSMGALTSLIIPVLASDPGSPQTGQFYYNTFTGGLRLWTGAFWDNV